MDDPILNLHDDNIYLGYRIRSDAHDKTSLSQSPLQLELACIHSGPISISPSLAAYVLALIIHPIVLAASLWPATICSAAFHTITYDALRAIGLSSKQ